MLAILKAGGAYVPIDPAYPRDRVQYMLANSEVSTVLTRARLVREFSDNLGRCPGLKNIICFDEADPSSPPAYAHGLAQYGSADVENLSASNLGTPNHASDPAYMIYTSGSTGKPKGVQVTHRSVVNLLLSAGQTIGINPKDRFLAVTTLSFDIAGLEIFLRFILRMSGE